MKATIETIALIRKADEDNVNANKAGVVAVMALIRDNLTERFPHGKAAELAAILKEGRVAPASAKRYAELCAMSVKAIAHQSALATSKAKPADKQTAKNASIEASLAELTSMGSMGKVRDWSKANGPKTKTTTKTATTKTATTKTEAPTEAPETAPIAPSIEALGQLREIREAIAMINAGQITAGEGLATIASIAGIQLAKSLPAPAGKAKDKANKPVPKAV